MRINNKLRATMADINADINKPIPAHSPTKLLDNQALDIINAYVSKSLPESITTTSTNTKNESTLDYISLPDSLIAKLTYRRPRPRTTEEAISALLQYAVPAPFPLTAFDPCPVIDPAPVVTHATNNVIMQKLLDYTIPEGYASDTRGITTRIKLLWHAFGFREPIKTSGHQHLLSMPDFAVSLAGTNHATKFWNLAIDAKLDEHGNRINRPILLYPATWDIFTNTNYDVSIYIARPDRSQSLKTHVCGPYTVKDAITHALVPKIPSQPINNYVSDFRTAKPNKAIWAKPLISPLTAIKPISSGTSTIISTSPITFLSKRDLRRLQPSNLVKSNS